MPVPFKTYADLECNLKRVESYEGFYSKNIKITFLVVLLTNLFVLMMNLLSQYPASKYWSLRRIEDVPSNVLRASPKDPIWPSWGHPDLTSQVRPNLTSWGRPEMTPRGSLNRTFKGRPWEVDSGFPLEDLQTTQTWISEKKKLNFLSELIRLTKSI